MELVHIYLIFYNEDTNFLAFLCFSSNFPLLDPDPHRYWMQIRIWEGKWMRIHADPDPQPCFRGKQISFKKLIFKTKRYRVKRHRKTFFVCWVTELWNFVFNSTLNLMPLIYPIFTCVDLDPYSEYGSGSTKFLSKDPIWIRILNSESSVLLNF